ncbi:MAG: cache domain-containing protein, partial [Pseudomonadota bacterium]
MLQRFKIGHKIISLSLLALIGLIIISTAELMSLRTTLLEDRKDKIRASTELLVSIADGYQQRVNRGEMDQEQAIDEFYSATSAGKYDGDIGYFFSFTTDFLTKMHAANPALVGQNLGTLQDSNGTYFIRELVKAGNNPQGGFSSYLWPKPGLPKEQTYEKLSYAHPLPWGDILGTGIYIDDVDTAFYKSATFAIIITVIIFIILAAFGVLIGRDISSGLKKLSNRMSLIANGNLDGEIEGQNRGDEVGDMALTVVAFRQQAVENRTLQNRQREMESKAEELRRSGLLDMADSLEKRVKGLIRSISASITEMKTASQEMQVASNTNSELSTAVASATAQTSANVQTVSAAAEELTASSDEIAQQISHS